MSLKYTDKGIIGGPISKDVLNLINKRQEVFGQTHNFSDDQLLYFNANTGWVKMTSSVNTKAKGKEDQKTFKLPYLPNPFGGAGFKDIEVPDIGSSDLAKKYVLMGGTLKDQAIRTGLVPDTDDARSAYELDEVFGYVPMPGIDGFQVQHEGTFGTLRIATVEFKANSIQQLTDLEALFLRPGYTMLLEWGHSIYLDKDGEVQTQIQTIGDEYFNMYKGTDVTKKINELRKLTNYNYEGMYGYVKNFTWSYSQNGEYDCKAFVISAGEIVESLQLAIFGQDKKEDSITSNIENSTPLHSYLHAVKSLCDSPNLTEDLLRNPEYKTLLDPTKQLLEDNNRELKVFSVEINKNSDDVTPDQYFKYIPLSNLLAFLNENYMLKTEDEALISFYINNDPTINNFTTFPQHFLVDPYIGFLPKGKAEQGKFRIKFAEVGDELSGDTDDILNICINVDFLLDVLNQKLDTNEEESKTVYDFIKEILSKLTTDAGKINDFDLHYEDEKFQFHVVDRAVTPAFSELADAVIDTIGLNTVVEDVSLNSKIPSSIAAMVAVSAQSAGSDVGEELLQMQRWNQGLVDRTQVNKNIRAVKKKNEKKPQISRIVKLLEKLQVDENKIYYNAEDYKAVTSDHIFTMKRFLQTYTSRARTNIPGLIPLELTLKLKGTAGFKIGEAFNISPTILPERYRGVVSFLINGVTNSISDNKWNTELTAQMIISGQFKGEEEMNTEGELLSVEDEVLVDVDLEEIIDEIPEDGLVQLMFPVGPSAVGRRVRNDAAGAGNFGAKRKLNIHKGVDYSIPPGVEMVSPFDGEVVSLGKNFSKGLSKIKLQGTGRFKDYGVTLGYVNPIRSLNVGDVVRQGHPVGSMGNLAGDSIFGPGYDDAKSGKMLNHLHLELRYKGIPVPHTGVFA